MLYTMLTCDMLLHIIESAVIRSCGDTQLHTPITYLLLLMYTHVLAMVVHITKFCLWCCTGKRQIAAILYSMDKTSCATWA